MFENNPAWEPSWPWFTGYLRLEEAVRVREALIAAESNLGQWVWVAGERVGPTSDYFGKCVEDFCSHMGAKRFEVQQLDTRVKLRVCR